MSDKAKAYRVVGIDLDIDGERVPEGSEIELVAEPSPKLARYLELLGPVEQAKPVKPNKPNKPADPAKPETPAKDAQPTGENQGNEGDDKKADDKAEETKA